MDEADKRTHTRAQYFLIKEAKEAIPIYAFRDPTDTLAIPALVVDLGDGGVQILTTNGVDLSLERYALELVVTGSTVDAAIGREPVQLVWSRPDGTNVRSGFAFSRGEEVGAKWSQLLEGQPHHLLRCVLHPLAG